MRQALPDPKEATDMAMLHLICERRSPILIRDESLACSVRLIR